MRLRITQMPLPGWSDLFKAVVSGRPAIGRLSMKWARDGDQARWFSRSAWSLVAIARWRQRILGKSTVTVWVPDYFCNESLALLRAEGAVLVFYPVDDSGHPDQDRFRVLAEENQPDLFLLVHYFGQPSPAGGAAAFCRNHGAWLVEDAAHVLHPIPGVGEAGDCVLYSPHKHLAIPDGAVLLIRSGGPAALAGDGDRLGVLDQVIAEILQDRPPVDMRAAHWLGKRLLQKLGIRPWRKPEGFSGDETAPSPVWDSPAMTSLAARLLTREVERLPSVAAHRSTLAAAWERTLTSIVPGGKQIVLPVAHAPYLACVAAGDRGTAEKLYAELQSIKLPVATWPDLPREVTASEHTHSSAIRFRYSRLYLPVHQSMSIQQIRAAADELRAPIQDRWQVRRVISHEEWERLWVQAKRKSLPQTWEYGSAKATSEGWGVLRYMVVDGEGTPTALFQVLVKGPAWLAGVARVNRGPLMLRDEPRGDHSLALQAIAALVREGRRNRWWMMQIAPFLPPGDEIEKSLRRLGFRKQSNCPADSALFSLDGSEEELIMRLDRKWRNCLRKGQKLGVKVLLDNGEPRHFAAMLALHRTQQLQKRFVGTSDALLRALEAQKSEAYKFNLFLVAQEAEHDDSPIGVLATIRFGDVAEYLLAAVNDKGRARQANSVLLWEAILHAKRSGCRWFDVGGLAANTPKPIADFKTGLNPEPYVLVGEWRRWL